MRLLAASNPKGMVRAYADDIGLITRLCREYLARVALFFAVFGTISGLLLNIPKTVFVPLTLAPPPQGDD